MTAFGFKWAFDSSDREVHAHSHSRQIGSVCVLQPPKQDDLHCSMQINVTRNHLTYWPQACPWDSVAGTFIHVDVTAALRKVHNPNRSLSTHWWPQSDFSFLFAASYTSDLTHNPVVLLAIAFSHLFFWMEFFSSNLATDATQHFNNCGIHCNLVYLICRKCKNQPCRICSMYHGHTLCKPWTRGCVCQNCKTSTAKRAVKAGLPGSVFQNPQRSTWFRQPSGRESHAFRSLSSTQVPPKGRFNMVSPTEDFPSDFPFVLESHKTPPDKDANLIWVTLKTATSLAILGEPNAPTTSSPAHTDDQRSLGWPGDWFKTFCTRWYTRGQTFTLKDIQPGLKFQGFASVFLDIPANTSWCPAHFEK